MKYDHPNAAIADLAERLSPVAIEPSTGDPVGRVLAQGVTADRDSPAADVSAMDGFAIRLSDLGRREPIPVCGQCVPGSPPCELQPGAVARVFTGAIVPSGTEAVLKREDTEELDAAIRLDESTAATNAGDHIRRSGENAPAGSVVLDAGVEITAAHIATMANFGCRRPDLLRKVRVCIMTTGDEVGEFIDQTPKPWQLRNSNRASLSALLAPRPWITVTDVDHCKDDRESLSEALRQRLAQCDAILMTGGVSMGDYDYVPEVVQQVGGETVFHGLPIRPGKPILGAATGEGKLIMGLPGNPVSATIGCRRMAMPLLARLGGVKTWLPPCPTVRLVDGGDKTIPLHWMRLVRLTVDGTAEAVISQGSGDLVSLGHSTGFVELPPGASGEGPWPYYSW